MPNKRDDTNCYWFPLELNLSREEFRKNSIIPVIVMACKNAGFKIGGHYRIKYEAIKFECLRFRFHDHAGYIQHKPRIKCNVQKPDEYHID